MDNKVAVADHKQARADMRLILSAEERAEKSLAQPRQPLTASPKAAPQKEAVK
jgi:hypothetical protein